MLNVWSGRECLVRILEGAGEQEVVRNKFQPSTTLLCKHKKPELHTQLQNTHGFSLEVRFVGNFARMNSNCSEIFSENCGICESLGEFSLLSNGMLVGGVSSSPFGKCLAHCLFTFLRAVALHLLATLPHNSTCISCELKVADLEDKVGEIKQKVRIKFLRVLKNLWWGFCVKRVSTCIMHYNSTKDHHTGIVILHVVTQFKAE